jgi:hypothetical protein
MTRRTPAIRASIARRGRVKVLVALEEILRVADPLERDQSVVGSCVVYLADPVAAIVGIEVIDIRAGRPRFLRFIESAHPSNIRLYQPRILPASDDGEIVGASWWKNAMALNATRLSALHR